MRRVLIFTVAVGRDDDDSLRSGPSASATGIDVTTQLESTRTIGGRNRSRLNRVLMVTQIALSLVLLVITGLFVRTLNNLGNVDVGFNRSSLILFRIDATSAGYSSDRYVELQSRLQERLARLPGVESVTYSSVALLSECPSEQAIQHSGPHVAPRRSDDRQHERAGPEFLSGHAAPDRPRVAASTSTTGIRLLWWRW